MNPDSLINSLQGFPDMLCAAVAGLSHEDRRWRPNDSTWSVLEIVCHLADEEADDFRPRICMTLEDAQQTWPAIDPQHAATERGYRDANFDSMLERFMQERDASLQWLRSLNAPQWNITYEHPRGPIAAADLLASWAAHDLLHLRQITKRRFQLIQRDSNPYSTLYAGQW